MSNLQWFALMAAIGGFLGWAVAYLQYRLHAGPFAKKVEANNSKER